MGRHLLYSLILLSMLGPFARAGDWPQWRGPSFNGSTDETNLPAVVSKTDNLLWSATLPGHGASTPIVSNGRIYLTCVDPATQKVIGLCLNLADGKLIWKVELAANLPKHPSNDMATPSAIADGKAIYFFCGTGDLAATDLDGKVLWSRNLQKDCGNFNIQFLYGCSPLLYKGKLYIPILRRERPYKPTEYQINPASYLLAIDPATGKDIFKVTRPTVADGESKESYATPMPFEFNGRGEILLDGGDCVTGHDPETGKELWRCGGWNDSHIGNLRIVPSVLVAGDRLILCAPKVRGHTQAIKAGGSGVITDTHIAWRNADAKSDAPTPLYYRGNVYVLDGDFKKGLYCLDPATGQVKWSTRVESRPPLRSSPLGADGKIYFTNEAGELWALSAEDGKVLSHTSLGSEGTARASVVAAHGTVLVRTGNVLYAFGLRKDAK